MRIQMRISTFKILPRRLPPQKTGWHEGDLLLVFGSFFWYPIASPR